MYLFTTPRYKWDGYKTLKEGDEVEFDIVQGQKGPQADAVLRDKDAAHTRSLAARPGRNCKTLPWAVNLNCVPGFPGSMKGVRYPAC